MDPAIIAALIQAGGGLLSNSLNNSKGGSTGQTVYNFNDPQDQAMRQQSQAFMSDQLNALNAGQAPAWLNNYLNPEQSYLLNQNQNQMFGKPGQAGGSIMDVASSMGAMSGLGGAAAMSPTNNALSQYADRMNGINQYIAGLKNQYMTNAASQIPSQLYQTARQDNQIANNSIPGTANTVPNFGTAFSGVNWNNVFGSNGQQQTAVPGGNYVPQQQSFSLPPSGNTNYGLPTGNPLQNALWSPSNQ